jgi:hypothetical protein
MMRAVIVAAISWLAFDAAAADGGATLRLRDGTLTIRYEFASGQDRVSFANNEERTHSSVREGFWKTDTACFAIEQGGIRRLSPSCGSAEVALTWDEMERDRMYPAIVTLRNGGVLVYAANIESLTPDGKRVADLRVEAPPGGVAAFRDRKSKDSLTLEGKLFERDGSAWIYLGPDRFVDEGVARVLVDDGIPPELRATMVDLAPRFIKVYSDRTGSKLDVEPTFYLTWAARARPGRSFQADVVPGAVVRFTVIGEGWGEASPEARAAFSQTVAHELAHLWNAGLYHPADWAAPWLSEGGAELFSVAARAAIGQLDARALNDRVSTALTECALLAGTRAWVQIPERDRGRIPYLCGMSIQLAVLAVVRKEDPSKDAFALWRDIWRESPHYYEAAFTQYLARHGSARAADVLQRMFIDPDLPLIDALKSLFDMAGVQLRTRAAPQASLVPVIGGRALAALMGPDCGGSYGFYRQQDHYRVGGVTDCKTFRTGMKIRFAEGQDLYSKPADAIAAVHAACAERRSARIATLDGEEIAVACDDQTLSKLLDLQNGLEFDADQIALLISSR